MAQSKYKELLDRAKGLHQISFENARRTLAEFNGSANRNQVLKNMMEGVTLSEDEKELLFDDDDVSDSDSSDSEDSDDEMSLDGDSEEGDEEGDEEEVELSQVLELTADDVDDLEPEEAVQMLKAVLAAKESGEISVSDEEEGGEEDELDFSEMGVDDESGEDEEGGEEDEDEDEEETKNESRRIREKLVEVKMAKARKLFIERFNKRVEERRMLRENKTVLSEAITLDKELSKKFFGTENPAEVVIKWLNGIGVKEGMEAEQAREVIKAKGKDAFAKLLMATSAFHSELEESGLSVDEFISNLKKSSGYTLETFAKRASEYAVEWKQTDTYIQEFAEAYVGGTDKAKLQKMAEKMFTKTDSLFAKAAKKIGAALSGNKGEEIATANEDSDAFFGSFAESKSNNGKKLIAENNKLKKLAKSLMIENKKLVTLAEKTIGGLEDFNYQLAYLQKFMMNNPLWESYSRSQKVRVIQLFDRAKDETQLKGIYNKLMAESKKVLSEMKQSRKKVSSDKVTKAKQTVNTKKKALTESVTNSNILKRMNQIAGTDIDE